jgi:hypothetical protein
VQELETSNAQLKASLESAAEMQSKYEAALSEKADWDREFERLLKGKERCEPAGLHDRGRGLWYQF